ncbi:MAG TPA: hypothetical protein ENK14_13535 [Caldithrix sp.]|nr:hypothetical protein [Caldithrix sp.]
MSSLIGWKDYLKASPEKFLDVVPEIERDLDRLQKVTNRFSKIGSAPDLKEEHLQPIVDDILRYFNRRMPGGKRKITLKTNINPKLPPLLINRDLFSWVLENLVKNAMDAMEEPDGSIQIISDFLNENQIFIDIADTGKGIAQRDRKNIFKPGFSTKKRGWGLGLSLAKRIIEESHGGKIQLKTSQQNKGSVFRIVLNLKKSPVA